jgi:CheY-like chemotaxis protein
VPGPHAALAALNRQPAISLMLVDVVMPEMDGYDLVAEARKISPGIGGVFMSAFARDTARHGGAAPSDDYLVMLTPSYSSFSKRPGSRLFSAQTYS